MWGVVPAAGTGSRIQPLAFSKELLPVGSRREGGVERPRAVSEYLLERMVRAGATRIALVIAPGKHDIVQYYGADFEGASLCYVVQPRPAGLCDALFRVMPLVAAGEEVLVGLPDTIWLPADGFARLPRGEFSMLTFPVERPELFDAVVSNPDGRVAQVQVKREDAASSWIWGAVRLSGGALSELWRLWRERERRDQYLGTLVNAYIAAGGCVRAVAAGEGYVDVGTLHGYRQAIELLHGRAETDPRSEEW